MFNKIKRAIRDHKVDKAKKRIRKALSKSIGALYWTATFLDTMHITRQAKREFWRKFASGDNPAQYIDLFLNGQTK